MVRRELRRELFLVDMIFKFVQTSSWSHFLARHSWSSCPSCHIKTTMIHFVVHCLPAVVPALLCFVGSSPFVGRFLSFSIRCFSKEETLLHLLFLASGRSDTFSSLFLRFHPLARKPLIPIWRKRALTSASEQESRSLCKCIGKGTRRLQDEMQPDSGRISGIHKQTHLEERCNTFN